MKLLVKLGGALLESAESRDRLAQELAGAARQCSLTVLHGGGKQMNRYLAEREVESTFVNGLRVTSPEVLDAVVKVIGGTVNQELVAALLRAGASPVGLTGSAGAMVEAEPLDASLGAVGKPVRASAALLDALTAAGFLPVVACIAADRQGSLYNVNADQMASAIGGALRADVMLFLTDVPGVRGAAGEHLSLLDEPQCRELMSSGVATGGMHAKLTACLEALSAGVGEVVVTGGSEPGVLRRVIAGDRPGTRIVLSRGAAEAGR